MPKVPQGSGIVRSTQQRINQAATQNHLQLVAPTRSTQVSSSPPKKARGNRAQIETRKNPIRHPTHDSSFVNRPLGTGMDDLHGYRDRKSNDQDNANNLIKRLTGKE